MDASAHEGHGRGLGAFLHEARDDILTRWQARVRRGIVSAKTLNQEQLLDHLPNLLSRIAGMVEDLEAGRPIRDPGDLTDTHAVERLEEGYDLDEVVREFAALRDCVLELWAKEPNRAIGSPLLNHAIDEAVTTAVVKYTRARERTLTALDRISATALETHNLGDMLRALTAVLRDTTPAIDSAAIYLREGDEMCLRAAVGMEEGAADKLRVEIGSDTCAGEIAATGRPLEIAEAARDRRMTDEVRRGGAKAFYGVPMLRSGEVVGVAHMASATAAGFSTEDKLLFRVMVERAASAITNHQLVDALDGERKQEQKARAATDQAFAMIDAMFVGAPIGLAFFDRELRYVRVNDVLATEHGRSPLEHLGRTVAETHPAEAAFLEPKLREVLASGRGLSGLELTMESRLTGRDRDWQLHLYPVRLPEGHVIGVGLAVVDITELKSALRVRDDFLAVASHDLRSPLTAMTLQIETLLRKAGIKGEVIERSWVMPRLEKIRWQIQRVTSLLDALLDVSRIQAGQIVLEPEQLDLAALVREVAFRNAEQLASNGCELRLDARGPLMGRWDPLRLDQILSNLVSNASKYGRGAPVEIRVTADGETARISVHDGGVGIAKENLERIFERFERVGDKAAFSGSGLGLWIVRKFVDAMGGRIDVESEPGLGTTFTVELPRGELEPA